MNLKISAKKLLVVVFLITLTLIGILIFYFIQKTAPISTSAYVPLVVEQPNTELPLRLKIPRIDIDARIEYVGINQVGEMDTPENPNDVAWYNLGPRPGEVGSAVIAGHFGWKNNIPAVFDNLDELQPGDKIFVSDLHGVTTTFIVREIRVYDKDDETEAIFNSSDGKVHLNLITCAGDWSEAEKSRSNRLVIFTDKE